MNIHDACPCHQVTIYVTNFSEKKGIFYFIFLNNEKRVINVCRSKLKQTEMECEYLKRWFGSLTEQNRRLQREVEELRAMKVGPPTVISPHTSEPLPASTLTMCPRCERVTTTANGKTAVSTKVPTPAL